MWGKRSIVQPGFWAPNKLPTFYLLYYLLFSEPLDSSGHSPGCLEVLLGSFRLREVGEGT